MCFLENHVLDLEKADLCGVLILGKLHGDVLDVLFQRRNGGILKGIDAAAGLLNFLGKKLHGLFHFSKLQHIIKDFRKLLQCIIELSGGLRKTIRIDFRRIVVLRGEAVLRDIDAHDVFVLHTQFHTLARIQKGLLQHLRRHNGRGNLKRGKSSRQPFFHPCAQDFILFNDFHKLAHQLIAFVLQEFVPAAGCFQTAFELIEHHSGRGYSS